MPEWAISTIINDDFSGVSDDEAVLIQDFLLAEKIIYFLPPTGKSFFSPHNSLTDIGDDCVDCKAVVKQIHELRKDIKRGFAAQTQMDVESKEFQLKHKQLIERLVVEAGLLTAYNYRQYDYWRSLHTVYFRGLEKWI